MKNNLIFTDNDETIGFYKDIEASYIELIHDSLKNKDFENASIWIHELIEINEYNNYTGLLILSENNGIGFTCKKYEG